MEIEHKAEYRIERRHGDKSIVIKSGKYGVELMVMQNGFQWTTVNLDAELLNMLGAVVTQFKSLFKD